MACALNAKSCGEFRIALHRRYRAAALQNCDDWLLDRCAFSHKGDNAMLEEMMELLAHPEEVEICWHDGELYVRCVVQPVASPVPDQTCELEPA